MPAVFPWSNPLESSKEIVATLKVIDEADFFRIEIAGNFTGNSVIEVDTLWRRALAKSCARRFTVDITRLMSYETTGQKLLRYMHKHGATIAAATPRSLIFLAEITAASRIGPAPKPVQMRGEVKTTPINQKRAAAGGD